MKSMITPKTITTGIIILIISIGSWLLFNNSKNGAPINSSSPISEPTASINETEVSDQEEADKNTPPISNASSRMTKKFYGTYVTPQNSSISPERFTGFHTGLDFETTEAEQNEDVKISAICYGKLLTKASASGYGGYAVQSCTINDKEVTVIYGHLSLKSINLNAGDELKPGDYIGLLGKGYSPETDGERKHLHLSIHIGSGVNITGYLSNNANLSSWMDPKTVLGY